MEPAIGRQRNATWGRKDEEFMADFSLMAKRHLDETEYRIFRFHFILGADWRLCCRRLEMDRGSFFHAVYRIQQTLGRVFRETEPYGLFPVDEYFNGKARGDVDRKTATVIPFPQRPAHLAFPRPVRKTA
jgi:hypothetical protein